MRGRIDVLLDVITNDMALSAQELRALRDAIDTKLDAAGPRPGKRTLYLPGEPLPDLDAHDEPGDE